jgi:hypothetical protein
MDAAAPLGNPVGVLGDVGNKTQGALADSRPWAMFGNPVGVHRSIL